MCSSSGKNGGFCSILKSELNPCQSYYDPVDASTGERLDVEACFGPPSWLHRIAKVALAGFVIYTWISTFVAAEFKDAYFFFLTMWTLSMQLIYHLFSVWNSFADSQDMNWRIKISWYLFNLVAHNTVLVALLYWTLDFDPSNTVTFNVVAPHGATAVVTLMDGFLVNRIPIRFYHWLGAVVPYQIAYLVWTILHMIFDLGNPHKYDEEEETYDDTLYDVVDWKDEALSTAITFAIVVLVVGPILQLLLFTLSLYLPFCRNSRRYEQTKQEHTSNDEEMYAGVY